MNTRGMALLALLLAVPMGAPRAQEDFGTRLGVRRGGEVSFEPYGPGVLFDALDPAVKKWYVPQELVNEYQWKQWEYTNYARDPYKRYVNIAIEGNYFYDVYGNFLTKGWLIYDMNLSEPEFAGSKLFKTQQFGQFFSNLVIASDSKGEYFAAVTVGNEIRTTLTPLTFSKPVFDGIQFDLASDKHQATLILSRPSGMQSSFTEPNDRTNITNLVGGRMTTQIGDFVRVGATYVNVYNARTRGQAFAGNPFQGSLTEDQNSDITEIQLRLGDDSPEDLTGGAALFLEEMIITTRDGRHISNRRRLTNEDGSESSILEYHPVVEGGLQREGYRSADGRETILLKYQLDGPEYRAAFGPPPADIKKARFRLLMANDYRIDVTSNNQTNRLEQPVFIADAISERTVRAAGNVQDGSNQRFVTIDYGLPTANEIYGFTMEVENVGGFNLVGEWDRNRQHQRYPRFGQNDPTKHAASLTSADAWMVNLFKRAYPFFVSGEAYSMDPDYSTSSYMATEETDAGPVRYDSQIQSVYELVDDNDDQDRYVDWQRRGSGSVDTRVFPGWDENNDFIADFNQNDIYLIRPNVQPDWEEPFLRYSVDRPEFLFGVDMNNNRYIDRFENDDQPDYPYRRDRRGYNIYGGTFLGPYARLSLGRQDERQLAEDRHNTTNYALLTYERDVANLGKLRLFQNLRRAEDDIKESIIIWRISDGIAGELRPREDMLPARNAWVNTSYLQFDLRRWESLNFISKLKYELWHQVDYDEWQQAGDILATEDIREDASFLGVINKVDYTLRLGNLMLQPRWKSEYQRYVPSLKESELERATSELRESAFVIVRYPIMPHTVMQAGAEYLLSRQFRGEAKRTLAGSSRDERVGALQLTNRTPYQGYEVYTQAGIRVTNTDIDFLNDSQTETFMYFTVYAGFGG
ncbi:MAG: hypothetical protein AB1505_21540 [Candidatus Latescibacterota bacterium]